ncbi:MAG: nicotinamide riboside transporter PnuC [Lutibacter sp.]|nr:nicotinamide riboside transporter PnuC [Lutibacter sp.]
MTDFLHFFLEAYRNTPPLWILLEALAFAFGIISVVYAKKARILVYPTGLVATTITVYLLYKAAYFGYIILNLYYSAMCLYGCYNWARKKNDQVLVKISRINRKETWVGTGFFLITMGVTYAVYKGFGKPLELVNYIDIVSSGIFFTAMWYMANKKLESWVLWVLGDIITVPLYAYRGLGMLSLQYLIFTILAIQGYLAWKKHLDNTVQTK